MMLISRPWRINLGSFNACFMTRDRDCLACHSAFESMIAEMPSPQAQWQKLPRRTLAAGDVLLRQGETTQHLWFIRQGLARTFFLSAEGVERNRSFHAEGAWIGGGAPPLPSLSPYTVQALEPLHVVEMSYTQLQHWLVQLPEARHLLEDGLRAVFEKQAAREAELLLLGASERYKAFGDEYGDIAQRLPLHHIASYLGITNVALSRIRSRMGLTPPRRSKALA